MKGLPIVLKFISITIYSFFAYKISNNIWIGLFSYFYIFALSIDLFLKGYLIGTEDNQIKKL